MPPAVRSPEVQADGRVTFRFRAANAQAVTVNREGAAPLSMTKDDKGIWSVSTEPLSPDFYAYSFVVDGASQSDPANPLLKASFMGGSQSLLHVPGPNSLSWENNNVPHGAIHQHFYQSGVVGEERGFVVYTPPGYDARNRRRYPVLYLLHGLTDDANGWTMVGRANIILDNLIAQGKAQPMLIVNPLGYGMANAANNLGALFNPATAQQMRDKFTATLLDEIIPQVENLYRVDTKRAARAVAGLSMGGAQSLSIGLNHPERFAWIGSFSGAFIMLDRPEKTFPALSAKINNQIRLLWIACGTGDFLIDSDREWRDWLKNKGVALTYLETPGAHTWMVWRRNLTAFAPLLFQPRAR